MNITTVIVIAFGLSMDAFAVSITNGMLLVKTRAKHAFKVGAFFGIAQAIMPIIGWLLGIKFRGYINKVDHWIAFILLGVIGGKMIYESLTAKDNEDEKNEYNLCNKTLSFLAIATSIDALAVGISLAFLNVSIIQSGIIIGIITFVMCFLGVMIGKKCGPILENRAELIGGIVLILIGANILMDHLNIKLF